MRKLLFLLFLLASPLAAFAQGMRYDNFVLKPLAAGGVTPVSGALITVCTSAGTGTPCTPKVANIYSDEALTTPITGTGGAGTTNSDANGNFGFYLTPGSYIITVTGSGITSYTIKVVLPLGIATAFVTPSIPASLITYGAKCDGRIVTDWTQSSGSTSFSTASGALTQADVGKLVGINNGTSGSPNALLSTTIATVTSSTTGTTAAAPNRAITPAVGGGDGWAAIGTDDSTALTAAVKANSWVVIPSNVKCTYKTSILVESISKFNMSGFGSSSELIFLPVPPLTTGVNNAAIFVQSNFSGRRAITSASIAVGATSFTAAVGDVSDLLPNDWLVITEGDSGAGEVVFTDWVQVQSVAGTTVNIKGTFRPGISQTVAFDNARNPFQVSPPNGLGFFRIIPSQMSSDFKFKDFRITAPTASASSFSIGLYLYAVKDAEVSGLYINVGNGQPISTYDAKQINIHDNTIEGISRKITEIASTVDSHVDRNHFSNQGNALDSTTTTPSASPLTLDFGSAFSTVIGNTIDEAGNIGIFLNAAHDLTIQGNTIGYVRNVATTPSGIVGQGAQNNKIDGNVLSAADASGTALSFGNSSGFTVTINDAFNFIGQNFIGSTWATRASLTAATDVIDDRLGSSGGGIRTLNGNSFKLSTPSSVFIFCDTADTSSQCNGRISGTDKVAIDSATFFPPTAGAPVDLGKNSAPWASLSIGTAATNNFKFQPAATAAARTISIADPLGNTSLPLTIASGTKALNTASITTATCDAGAAVTATGTLSTDTVDWSFNAAPTATNKYGAFLVVYAVPSANTVTFYTCNPSATTSTPTAMTVNWSVRRP